MFSTVLHVTARAKCLGGWWRGEKDPNADMDVNKRLKVI